MKSQLFTMSMLLCVLLASIAPELPLVASNPPVTASAAPAQIANLPENQPVAFITNVGQFDADVRFQVRGQHSTLFLTDDSIWLTVVDPHTLVAPPQRRGASSQQLSSIEPLRGTTAPAPRGVNLRLSFVGANTRPQLEPFARSAAHYSFFRGDQANWHADVPVWSGVRYRDLYPGIDLELRGAHGQIEQRLHARRGADLSAVRMRVEGAVAQSIAGNDLRLQTAAGEIAMPLFQVDTDDAAPLARSFKPAPTIEGTDVRAPFAQPASAASAPAAQSALGVNYSTLFGGTFDDTLADLAVGSDGAAYIVGSTFSPDFPTTPGAFDQNCGNDNACNYDGSFYYYDTVIAKLNPAGTDRIYATFLGGQNSDFGYSIAIDGNGAAYVTGETYSPDFPTTNGAFDRSCGADDKCSFDPDSGYFADGFVAKLNPTGTALSYATFLGDINYDWGNAVAVDGAGAAYITGVTYSPGFPTTNGAFDRECGTDATCTYDSDTNTVRSDAFITKLNPAGSALIYSTFIGATNTDNGFDIAVDQSGEAYISGNTTSDDMPTTSGAFDRSCGTEGTCDYDGVDTVYYDAFVAKINAAGSSLAYLTYLGGSGGDGGFSITVDQTKAAYVTGYTFSATGFPSLPNSFDPSFNGLEDAFVVKLNPAGSGLQYSTFLGGDDGEDGRSIAVDTNGSAYVAGLTFSANFPTTQDGYDASFNGADDAFVAQLDPAGKQLVYSTFGGGDSTDEAYGIGLGSDGSVYIGGLTSSANFPVTTSAAYTEATCGSEPDTHPCYDMFVARLAPISTAPEHTRVFLPLSMRLTAIAPDPLCDPYEPNNSRVNSSTPLNLGTTITAKVCQKEGLAVPDSLYQDNYRVSTSQSKPLQIRLTLPQSLVVHIALAVYNSQSPVSPINGCYIDEVRATPFTLNCKIPDAGAYVVRIYSWDGVVDNTQPYTLLVTQ